MSFFNSKAFKQGISFGIVSSTMTVLGVSIGMWTSGGKIDTLIASILGLSISNSFADSFSMYMANTAIKNSNIALTSSLVTGGIEFLLPFLFTIPLIFLKLETAIYTNIILGFLLVGGMGYYVSVLNNLSSYMTIRQIIFYLLVLAGILISTSLSGKLIAKIKPDITNLNNRITKNDGDDDKKEMGKSEK
jgi:hypothetical protein